MRSLIVGTLLAATALPGSAQNLICGVYSKEVPAIVSSVPTHAGSLHLELGLNKNNQQPYLTATLDDTINALPGEGYVRDVVVTHSQYNPEKNEMVVLERESIYDSKPFEQGLLLGTIPLIITNPMQSERIWDPARANEISVTYTLSNALNLPEDMRGREIKATLYYSPAYKTLECSCSEAK